MPPQPPLPHSTKPDKSSGSLFGAPPVYTPPTKKGKGTARDKYIAWAKKKGIAARFASDIYYWSGQYKNLDPYLWSSVLLTESGAKHITGNGSIVSSGQAVGIGQIALSWVGQPIPWDPGHVFSGDNNPRTGIASYGVNIRMSAYLFSDAVNKYGWKNAYTEGYNPNDPNKGKAWAAIQKTYSSRPAGAAPEGPSAGAGPKTTPGTTAYSLPFKDPYVTGVQKGPAGKFSTTDDANKAMQYDGAPLTRSQFLSLKDSLTSHYVSYTGKRPTNAQISQFITKGWNPYTLDVLLSKSKNFKNSPLYKQYSANFGAQVKDLLPAGAKIPEELLRQAVVNNWDASALAAKLRQQNNYTASNEFKGNVATLLNVHDSIMGTPDADSMLTIKDAALAGWTPDQYAAFLRAQPTYSRSPEYQTKALGFLSSIGLITGAQSVLQKGVAPGPGSVQPSTQGALPSDKRIKGNPNNDPAPSDLGATLSRV